VLQERRRSIRRHLMRSVNVLEGPRHSQNRLHTSMEGLVGVRMPVASLAFYPREMHSASKSPRGSVPCPTSGSGLTRNEESVESAIDVGGERPSLSRPANLGILPRHRLRSRPSR
jgi:hypothetical protein